MDETYVKVAGRDAAMPVDRPTVANAEIASNSTGSRVQVGSSRNTIPCCLSADGKGGNVI